MNTKTRKGTFMKATDAMLLPHLIQLEENLIIAAFELMKLMPAKYTIEKAYREGRVNPRSPVVETSSGSYAMGMAMVCAELGLPFVVVTDPAVDEGLKSRMEDLGGGIHIVNKGGYNGAELQVLRLRALEEMRSRDRGSFWTRQYDNPDNRDAYASFARFLVDKLGHDFTLVGTVGSGGSTCGTISVIRETNPRARLVGVDTFGSVLFGLPNGKRQLRGLGNSVYPENLSHECFDEVHWVTAADAFAHTRRLYTSHALFCGPTTGAAYQVARWVAARNRNERVVFIAPDKGDRYQATVYRDGWLAQEGFDINQPSEEPRRVNRLADVRPQWSCIDWGRRKIDQLDAAPR